MASGQKRACKISCPQRILLWSWLIAGGNAFNIAHGIFGKRPLTDRVDKFVLALATGPGPDARIAATRATRLGFRSAIVTSKLPAYKAAMQFKPAENETWIEYKRPKLQDMVPFEAYKHFGDSFEWMFVGEDDTVFFPAAAQRVTAGLDPQQPHFLTDETWFAVPGKGRHISRAEVAQCVPCNYSKDMALLPDHMRRGCPYCSVSGPILPGFCGPQGHANYGPHGGPGYLLSIGIFKKISYSRMRTCLEGNRDIYLARCFWKMEIGITDPNPIWHPDRLTHFDPTPPPYLTHNNIMEKTSFALGKLLRAKAGACGGLCAEEVKHMISLHINADRLGYTQQGDPRVGNFRDTRQREYAGQLVLQAISHLLHHLSAHRNSSYQLHKLEGIAGLKAAEADSEKADQHISEALNQIQQWSSFFKGGAKEVVKVARSTQNASAQLTSDIVEAARSRVAARIAKDALKSIQRIVLAKVS